MLYAPPSFHKASIGELARVCNGCGPQSWKHDLIPDTVWGLSIAKACNIHDWMYEHGTELADKDKADRVFLNNMLRLVAEGSRWGLLRFLRRRRCWKYYLAVSRFGGPAFWAGKPDAPEAMVA